MPVNQSLLAKGTADACNSISICDVVTVYSLLHKIDLFVIYIVWVVISIFSGLTHWSRVTHKCVGKLIIIGSDNGLSPGRRQAIIWTNAGMWSMWPLGTNFSEILIEIHIFLFKNMHLKMSYAKWRLFCLGLNVLMWSVPIYQVIGRSRLP